MFGRKEKEATTLREVLGNDSVKHVIEDFINEHLTTAEGIIIIWAEKGNVKLDTDGFSEAEAIGSMQLMEHRIDHEGLPRR